MEKGAKIAIGVGLGILAILGIVLFIQSRRKVREGVEYDLSPAAEMFSLSPTQEIGGATGTANAPPVASANVLNPNTEPARSLIAQQMEVLYTSPNTMDDIRTRYGAGSGLFSGMDGDTVSKVKRFFAEKFSINPDSYLSYPLWTEKEDRNLLPELKQRAAPIQYNELYTTAKDAKINFLNALKINAWGVSFIDMFKSSDGTINPPNPQQWLSMQYFFRNAVAAIEKLQNGVKNEAIQILRRKGYKFEGYDLNPVS